ncbi:hypothetical protein DPMN_118452 [Dreissena polymorpha]|uniref:Uncharacterized protein n=1 Tax=Dreissena polymorpha TaxID=45954 RepID=A0A9D4GHF4_DREPO|nr:hypothetical protein DPMN_118452 [Dreissena polymorpha]
MSEKILLCIRTESNAESESQRNTTICNTVHHNATTSVAEQSYLTTSLNSRVGCLET